ncbi:uncharacterized protein LOC118432801 [Branchiostoma floridae]|uniref:Uncharacterized protein LOC118432801 n=1 Tax=Branchiostoma floridae TaxID=7739 RepID=A0A9J7MFJ1_BRAFL|nr:uncharacterized protein LOC118432801 [Branchiostoma floridae]
MNGQATVWQKGAGVVLFFGFLATCVYYYKTDRLQSSLEPFQDARTFYDKNGELRQFDGFPLKTLLDDLNKTSALDRSHEKNTSVSRKSMVQDRQSLANEIQETGINGKVSHSHNVSATSQFTKLTRSPRVFSNNVTNNELTQKPVTLSELRKDEKPPETPEQSIVEIAGLPTVYEPTAYPEHIVVRLNATFEGNISIAHTHTVQDVAKTTETPKTTSINNIQQNSQYSRLFDVLTSASTSRIEVLTQKGPVYHLGDSLEVRIQARDGLNRPKTRGGDYFKAKIFNPSLLASSAGRVTDHGDGTYTVRFRLSWSGQAQC